MSGFEDEEDCGMYDEVGMKKMDDLCLNCEVNGCLREMVWVKKSLWINGEYVERMVRNGGSCWKLFEMELKGGYRSKINGWGNEKGLEMMDGINGWGEDKVGKVVDDVWRDVLRFEKMEREERKKLVLERMEEYKRKWKDGSYLVEWRKRENVMKRLRKVEKEIEERNRVG